MINSKDLQSLNELTREQYKKHQKMQTCLKHIGNNLMFSKIELCEYDIIPETFNFGMQSPHFTLWINPKTGERLLQSFDDYGNFNGVFDIGIFNPEDCSEDGGDFSPVEDCPGQSQGLNIKKKTNSTYKDWQLDPDNLDTEKVQYWTGSGTMLTLIDLEDAKKLVEDRKAFVINSQAINQI